MPALKSSHNTFYVDPVKGSMSGDGSAARPWSTLTEVLDPANKLIATQSHGAGYSKGTDTALHPLNPAAPVKPGDVILLMSGNHGSPKLLNMFNSDFITIAAAPGAMPIVGPTAFVSTAKWMFQGITFEGMVTTATGATSIHTTNKMLVTTGQGDWIGRTSDIVFDNDTFRTAASTSGWSNYDWYNKPYAFSLGLRAPCSTVTNSHLYNIISGIYVDQPNSLIQGNTVEYFSNDGFDIAASNLLIKSNTIRNGVNNTVDPLHSDGIQGWSVITNGTAATNSNVVIDGNILTKTGDLSVTYMMGISIFDGKWDGLVIQNNVVDNNHWHSISVYGGTNTKILNNTVIAADPVNHPSWILMHDGKDGSTATGVVRNNIATSIVIQGNATTFDHNIAALKITLPSGVTSSGTVGNANAVVPAVLTGFMALDTTKGIFDMRIKPTSVAVGAGTLSGAPALDILGQARTAPVDLGAYIHQDSGSSTASLSPSLQKASSSP